MGKLYSSAQQLAATAITKIALPTDNIQNCDSAINSQSSYENAAKMWI
jgi:hypothetical protein